MAKSGSATVIITCIDLFNSSFPDPTNNAGGTVINVDPIFVSPATNDYTIGNVTFPAGCDGGEFGLELTPATPPDSDEDGVPDDTDQCPNSGLDDISLNPNQYAQNPDNSNFGPFEVGPNDDQSVVYDMETTDGCTCAQIIEALGVGKGHSKKGCSPSVMEDFTGISANPDRKAGIGRK